MRNKLILIPVAASILAAFSFSGNKEKKPQAEPTRKIQVALLLDVSNSMDGLINQAKAQLWSMVTTLAKAQCTDNVVPQVEVALYEYGRTNNDVAKGYVKKLSDFTQDLDNVSTILFGLNTHGGDEYCGQVIYTSLDELNWTNATDNYKVIFIAGNEDFLQGKIQFTEACAKAKDKGVVVNTIYCGDKMRGIAEHWDLGVECGRGSYTNINSNAREYDIPTPYDSALMVMNGKLNYTYVTYGYDGGANFAKQAQVDQLNYKLSAKAGAKRAEAKAMSNAYYNGSWDLVDAMKNDTTYYLRVDKKTLPDSLKNKSAEELKLFVQQKTNERASIQQEIIKLNNSRTQYITQKSKEANQPGEETLETAVESAIREQVKRYNMTIPKQ